MKISIYQIDLKRDADRVAFLAFNTIGERQKSSEVNPAIYCKVFAGDVDCDSLESVFLTFNLYHPDGYEGHSMSVSDVVEVEETTEWVEKGFYYCDMIGFQKIQFDPAKCAEKGEGWHE